MKLQSVRRLVRVGSSKLCLLSANKEEEKEEEEEEEEEQLDEVVQDEDGWSYLHLVVATYVRLKKAGREERARLLIRVIYRLALAGIDVNARDVSGRTALVLAAATSADESGNIDQSLIAHLLRIGQFSTPPQFVCMYVCLSVCPRAYLWNR